MQYIFVPYSALICMRIYTFLVRLGALGSSQLRKISGTSVNKGGGRDGNQQEILLPIQCSCSE